MTNDKLLSELRADWRRQTVDIDRIRRLIEVRRRWIRFGLIVKATGAGIALLSGGWFFWLALTGGAAIFALASIALLVALPLMLLELAGTARSLRIGHDGTPSGVLRRARDQATTARHLLWGSRVAALLLAVSAAGLLALHVAGRAHAEEALVFMLAWAFLALGLWVWQARRGRRLTAEIARCNALLAELGEADDA